MSADIDPPKKDDEARHDSIKSGLVLGVQRCYPSKSSLRKLDFFLGLE